jgi:hypothetical protein
VTYDDIRVAVAKVDAIAHAAEATFDSAIWPPGADRRQTERIAHLVGAAREAAEAALSAVDELSTKICDESALASAIASAPRPDGWDGPR